MEDPEICQPQRKLPPRARPVAEHKTTGQPESRRRGNQLWHAINTACAVWVTTFEKVFKRLQSELILIVPVPGAVHGLECKDIFFHREGEHVFTVVLPVARCLPQFAVIDVRRGYFLKASSPVLLLEKQQNQINKLNLPGGLHKVLYWAELHHDVRHESRATAMEIGSFQIYLLYYFLSFSLSKTFNIQLSCFALM